MACLEKASKSAIGLILLWVIILTTIAVPTESQALRIQQWQDTMDSCSAQADLIGWAGSVSGHDPKFSSDDPGHNSAHCAHRFLTYEPRLGTRSGAENIVTLAGWISSAEDRLVKIRWFRETTVATKTFGVLYRGAKYVMLDLPVDSFLSVFTHEFYGHGARGREFGMRLSYSFDSPPPYGPGSGWTWFESYGYTTRHQELCLEAAGLEAHHLIDRNIAICWIERGSINYREASLYLVNAVMPFWYVHWTNDDLESNPTCHDVANYLQMINSYGSCVNGCPRLDVRELRTRNLVNLANPFLAYSMLAGFKAYIWDGSDSWCLPLIRIKGVDYLPSFAMVLTPFGPEYRMENFLRSKHRIGLFEITVGDPTFHKSWGGTGLVLKNICRHRGLATDISLNLWKQPKIELWDSRRRTIESKGGWGGAFSIRTRFDVMDCVQRGLGASTFIELGCKSAGYLPGYPLGSSLLFMVGFGVGHRD